ncbi:MAG: exodeoxyribonuclease V subunit beta [Lautropia sp.]
MSASIESSGAGAARAGVTTGPPALDVFDCPLEGSMLIEASAGTGKTWHICGLYLRLLLERGLDVRRILVVTFTHAATAELRDRIRQRLLDTLAAVRAPETCTDPFATELVERLLRRHGASADTLRARLDLALASFDEAAIFTIHGFCHRALSETPFTARMPLATQAIQDDGELLLAAVNDFWRRRIAGDALDPALAAWLVAKQDTPESCATLLARHLRKPAARARWPRGLEAGATTAGTIDTSALRAAHALARGLWHGERERIVDCVLDARGALNGTTYKPDSIEAAAGEWDALLHDADAIAALEAPPTKRLLAQDPKKAAKATLLETRTIVARANRPKPGGPALPSHAFFAAAQALIDAIRATGTALALARLALIRDMLDEAGRALREAKRRTGVVTFDDMLRNLHERLVDPSGRQAESLVDALRERYPAALIDEFQDTDPLQFAIFERLYGGTPLPCFFVGDPKQAIYSFRNADLHTYMRARTRARGEFTLRANQRSSQSLLRALNALFARNPKAFMVPGLDYREVGFGEKPRRPLADASVPAGAPGAAALQIWALPGADGDPGTMLHKRQAMDAAAAATAAEIARLLEAAARGEIRIGAAALRAGDVAVLVRRHADGALMRDALARLGIDSVELSQASVFTSVDAADLERVLAAILEPTRDPLLRSALGTDAMGLDAAALDALAADEAGLPAIVGRFGGYRERWLRNGIGTMLRDWLARERVTERMLARADGRRRLTNLLHLTEALHRACATHPAPDALMRWFRAQRRARRADDDAQLRLDSDQDLVQIVTIHKSKGLEYPIVFCPFAWSGSRGSAGGPTDGVEYHDDDGACVIDWCKGFDGEFDDADVDARRRLEESAESLRLAYVALTRAVHRCIVVAGCYRTGPATRPSDKEGRRSLLNWLVAGADVDPPAWHGHEPPVAAIGDAWRAFAAAAAPDVSLAPLPAPRVDPMAPARIAADALDALPAPARLPAGWWIGSYSALAWGAAHERAIADHDARAPGTEPTPPTPAEQAQRTGQAVDVAEDDVLNFARGAIAGECVHAVFETADFADRAAWPGAIAAALDRHRPDGDRRLHARRLERMLGDVLSTPLPVGTRRPLVLATLPRDRRIAEFAFHLPSRRLRDDTLNETLARLGYRVPTLGFGRLDGYLKGFVDLVFEHDGRFFLLDWKSNHLGTRVADYARASLEVAMHANGYHLQYLLYSVALDRWLRHRLPGYLPQAHFGGVLYLFVRGVRPGWQDADGQPAGHFFARPDDATVDTLSTLLEGRE